MKNFYLKRGSACRGRMIWKDIPGVTGYQASDTGEIKRSIAGKGTQAGRILKSGTIAIPGLCITDPSVAPRQRRVARGQGSVLGSVQVTRARLVCMAFNGLPWSTYEVGFHDEDRTNLRPDNLFWAPRGRHNGKLPNPLLREDGDQRA